MPAPFGAGISVCQRTCTVAHIGGRRAGPMCPAAQGDTDSPCLPLRGRWQREALAEGEIPHGFLSPSRLRRQPPPRGGLAARHRRADGTSYPKGICSAALHCGTPSPTSFYRRQMQKRRIFHPANDRKKCADFFVKTRRSHSSIKAQILRPADGKPTTAYRVYVEEV